MTMTSQPAKKAPGIRVEFQTCGKDYANQKNLKNHIEKDHKPEPTSDDENETYPAAASAAAPATTSDNDNKSANTFAQTEEQLQVESEMMEEFALQLDMLEEIKVMAQTETEPVDIKVEGIGEKLERFKTIVIKKNELLKETREDKLRLKHEVECRKQVENMQNQYIKAKENDIDRLMKEVKAEKDNSVSIIAESKNRRRKYSTLNQ